MKHTYYYILLAVLLGFISCNNELETLPVDCDPIPLRGIRADIDNDAGTRAVPLVDSIGKYSFLNTDEIVFTMIERTKRPIRPGFSYQNVRYSCTVEGTGNSQNVSWKRNNPQEDIFWSDGSEPHTFIGYILPHEDDKTATASGYDWKSITVDGQEVYYGSIGDPTQADEVIDYTAVPANEAGESIPYDLEKLRKEDLLLTYSTEMQNEDAMAQVHFHHGLASIRVVVTITGFSSTGMDPDSKTLVTDMQVHDQPTLYKWDGKSYKTDPLTESDQDVLNGFWSTNVQYDQTKKMNLWQSRQWRGSGASRTFTFYGIVAPSKQDMVKMTFTVTYPDPLNPSSTLTKPYTATLELPNSKKVEFRPGFCTNININLNHKDEKMTVGAEYLSWQNEPAPNEGSLRKKSTFMSTTSRDSVTILGDDNATFDDATWLYVDTKDNIIKDIYGNDGSETKPFLIKTADELLSFAYEVNEINRTAVSYYNVITQKIETIPADGSFDFTGYYIKLDADIIMQEDTKKETVSWIGIGDADKPFQGTFRGSGRKITRLKGAPLFNNVGDKALIDNVTIENPLMGDEKDSEGNINPNFGKYLTRNAALAQNNAGVICACRVNGDVGCTGDGAVGALVGTNTGTIFACHHIGLVKGNGVVAGLVGANTGSILFCYQAGELTGTTKFGVAPSGGTITDCYYDNKLATTVEAVTGVTGKSTGELQKRSFVDDVYSADEAKTENSNVEHLTADNNNKNPGEDGYIPTYKDGYTPVVAGDSKPSSTSDNSWNGRIHIWLTTGAGSSNARKDHYATHKYLYQPAAYPKVQ